MLCTQLVQRTSAISPVTSSPHARLPSIKVAVLKRVITACMHALGTFSNTHLEQTLLRAASCLYPVDISEKEPSCLDQ